MNLFYFLFLISYYLFIYICIYFLILMNISLAMASSMMITLICYFMLFYFISYLSIYLLICLFIYLFPYHPLAWRPTLWQWRPHDDLMWFLIVFDKHYFLFVYFLSVTTRLASDGVWHDDIIFFCFFNLFCFIYFRFIVYLFPYPTTILWRRHLAIWFYLISDMILFYFIAISYYYLFM